MNPTPSARQQSSVSSSATSALPPETRPLLLFQVCNASNFTIALGAPLVLLARYLGANEFHIGLISAIPPAAVGLQLLMTNVIDRVGYRESMLLGWTARSFMLLLIAPLPFLVGRVSEGWLIAGLLLPILGFNIIRGLASGAWLPWLQGLLPANRRGQFLGMEQRMMNFSGFVTLILCGFFLGTNPTEWHYAFLFVFAWAMGMASVYFLRKAPSIPPERRNSKARSLLEVLRMGPAIWRHAPFRRITRFVALMNIALVAIPAFLVLYMRDELGWSEGVVLKLQAVSTLGVLLTAVFWGKLSDSAGSRPLLRIGLSAQLLILVFWLAAALGIVQPTYLTAGIANFLYGVAAAMMAVSQMRLVLGSSPQGETTVSMAFYQVVVAATAGTAPVIWGAILSGMQPTGGMAAWSVPFALFFGVSIMVGLIAQYLLGMVREPQALPAGRLVVQAVYDWPVKVVSGAMFQGRGSKKRRREDIDPG